MSIISSLSEKDINIIQEIDKEIDSLTKLAADFGDLAARNDLESKLITMRLKREQLHAHIVISRSQSIIAEMKTKIAQNELDMGMCELRTLFKKLRRSDREHREAKKVKLSKINEGSEADQKCIKCKTKLSSKDSKSKDKTKSPKEKHAKQSKPKHTQQIKHDKCKDKKTEKEIITPTSRRITFEEPSIICSPERKDEKNGEDCEDGIVSEQQNTTNRLFKELLNTKDIQTVQIDIESMSTETVKIGCTCGANRFN